MESSQEKANAVVGITPGHLRRTTGAFQSFARPIGYDNAAIILFARLHKLVVMHKREAHYRSAQPT